MSGRCPYLEAAGLSALDNNEWKAVVREASEALLFPSSFTPPPAKTCKGSTGDDSRFAKPQAQRLVKAETKCAHPTEAQALKIFPGDGGALRYSLPPDVRSAIGVMLEHGAGLPGLRHRQMEKLRNLERRCQPITKRMHAMLRDQRPHSVRVVGDRMNVAFALSLASALQWPHKWLGRALLVGFRITGVMEQTGVLRQVEERVAQAEFAERAAEIRRGNREWLSKVHRRAERRATAAMEKAGTGSNTDLEILQRVERQTLKEIERGHAGRPWSLADLIKAFEQSDGSISCRVLLRSGVLQGGMKEEERIEPDGSRWTQLVQKLRVIDDAKRSLHNELQLHRETIHLCDFTFAGLVAQELVRQCQQRRWKFSAQLPEGASERAQKRARRGKGFGDDREFHVPGLIFGCEDLTAAFRLCPVAELEMNIVAVYCFTPPPGYDVPGVYYFPVHGHCFGFVSSINNFSTVPALFCAIARCALAVAVENYVDDFNCCDLRFPNAGRSCGGQDAVVELHRLFGWPIEASKHQEGATENKFLGMMTDTSKVTTLNRGPDEKLTVSFYPHEDRVAQILDLMNSHDPAWGGSGYMTPHEADVLLGKLGFLLRGAHGSVGRGASQPIYQRKHDDFGHTGWNTALTHSFAFFRKLFTAFPVRTWHLEADESPWLLVYTDACKNSRRGGIGIVIFDTATNKRYVSSAICPRDIEACFERGGHIINQLELLAILTALLTYPDLFRNRRVYWLIDNCSAISACVHGYANKLDMAKMANSVQLALCALGVRAHFDWVPTGANIADTPSRVSRASEMTALESHAWRANQLPPEDEWDTMVFPSVADLASYDCFDQLLPRGGTRCYTPATRRGRHEKSSD